MSDSICTGSHLNRRTFSDADYWASFQSTIVSGQVLSIEETMDKKPTNAEETNDTTTNDTRKSLNVDDEISMNELSTLIDDDCTEENLFEMNIDAIPNADLDERFFDCPSFEKSPANLQRPATMRNFNRSPQPYNNNIVIYSPQPYTQPDFYRVQFASPPKTYKNSNNGSNSKIDILASPRKQRPASARRISPKAPFDSLENNSSSHLGMKTGSYLVQMVDEFNKGLEDHAQSTPKLSSDDSGNPSTGSFNEIWSGVDQVRKTLDFQNADTVDVAKNNQEIVDIQNAETVILSASPKNKPKKLGSVDISLSPKRKSPKQFNVSASNKENFYAGKYSKFVAERRASLGKSPQRVYTRAGKVALLREFFQSHVNESIQGKMYKSRIPLPIRKTPYVRKAPQAKTRTLGSPSYQIRKSYKLVSSRSSSVSRVNHPSTATTFSSSGTESFLTRNQRKLPRSLRVQSCSDATNAELMSIDETCKSHSTSDLPSSNCDSSASIKALRSSKITKRTYLKMRESPMQTTSSPVRKSLTPKKISAINKRRSVGLQLKKNTSPVKPVCEIRKLWSPSVRAGMSVSNMSQKQVSTLAVPKIVITHQ